MNEAQKNLLVWSKSHILLEKWYSNQVSLTRRVVSFSSNLWKEWGQTQNLSDGSMNITLTGIPRETRENKGEQ